VEIPSGRCRSTAENCLSEREWWEDGRTHGLDLPKKVVVKHVVVGEANVDVFEVEEEVLKGGNGRQ
jgi:hypothetical protein